MIKRYRKRPVVIEAIKVKEYYRNLDEIVEFVGHENLCGIERRPDYELKIKTSEGDMVVKYGDYIIKEPFDKERKFYPCKPDVFEATYKQINMLCDHCGNDCKSTTWLEKCEDYR